EARRARGLPARVAHELLLVRGLEVLVEELSELDHVRDPQLLELRRLELHVHGEAADGRTACGRALERRLRAPDRLSRAGLKRAAEPRDVLAFACRRPFGQVLPELV